MARTLDPVAHGQRRDQFIDAALALMGSKGYELLSVQEILHATGASKGAFYHYFGSKSDLLEAIIARMVEAVLAEATPLLDDATIPAPQKLSRLFAGISSWKTQRKDLLERLLVNWYSDENVVVREKFRRGAATRLTPVLARIIEQGNAEGTFRVPSAAATADVFVALLLALNEHAGHVYLARHAGHVTFEEVVTTFTAYANALEMILGIPPGSLRLADDQTLRAWFGVTPKGHPLASMLERSSST